MAGGTNQFYLAGSLIGSGPDFDSTDTVFVRFGQDLSDAGASTDPDQIAYIDDVKVGTSRHGSDLFADDFSSGNLDAWTSTSGAVSVVNDPFAPTFTGSFTIPIVFGLRTKGSSFSLFPATPSSLTLTPSVDETLTLTPA